MTGKEILQAMNHIEEELIEDAKLDALEYSKKKKSWKPLNWVAVFAAIVVCVLGVTGAEASGLGDLLVQTFSEQDDLGVQTSHDWKVDYAVGAPAGSANPVVYRTLPYSSEGFYATCTAISGSYDRQVIITTTNLCGFKNGDAQYITDTGTSAIWRTNRVPIGPAQFKFVAFGYTNCSASGTIHCKE